MRIMTATCSCGLVPGRGGLKAAQETHHRVLAYLKAEREPMESYTGYALVDIIEWIMEQEEKIRTCSIFKEREAGT